MPGPGDLDRCLGYIGDRVLLGCRVHGGYHINGLSTAYHFGWRLGRGLFLWFWAQSSRFLRTLLAYSRGLSLIMCWGSNPTFLPSIPSIGSHSMSEAGFYFKDWVLKVTALVLSHPSGWYVLMPFE